MNIIRALTFDKIYRKKLKILVVVENYNSFRMFDRVVINLLNNLYPIQKTNLRLGKFFVENKLVEMIVCIENFPGINSFLRGRKFDIIYAENLSYVIFNNFRTNTLGSNMKKPIRPLFDDNGSYNIDYKELYDSTYRHEKNFL